MGIKGLWQAMQSYIQDGHLSQFKGKRVSVDMYVWLHQGIRHGMELNEERVWRHFEALDARVSGDQTEGEAASGDGLEGPSEAALKMEDAYLMNDRYVDYIVQKVDALLRYGAVPVCVFDGAEMPMKRRTNVERQERREANFQQALRLLEGNYRRSRAGQRRGFQTHARSYSEALECLWKAVDVSTELAHILIQVLREERRVECLVAPYEAEAQMAYLCRQGYVEAALSEDSDLIAYYCPCIIAKVETASGRCVVVHPKVSVPAFFSSIAAMNLPQRARARGDGILAEARPLNSSTSSTNPAPAPIPFSYESFLLGCIMSGCDYLANLRNIGVKTAFKLVSHARSLVEVLQLLKTQFGFPADELQSYRRRLLDAFYCFAHHIVYDPSLRKLMTFFPLPNSSPSLSSSALALREDLVGSMWSVEETHRVCEECLFDPNTHRLYVGSFNSCLSAYLRRARRGQVRLTTFSGFTAKQAPKVVLDPQQKRAEAEFGPGPLQKVREAAGVWAQGAPKVMVRSRYFLRSGRLHAQEDWSASSGTSGGEGLAGGGGSQDSASHTAPSSDSATLASQEFGEKAPTSPSFRAREAAGPTARTPLADSTSGARGSGLLGSPSTAATPPPARAEKGLWVGEGAEEAWRPSHPGPKRERPPSQDDASTSARAASEGVEQPSQGIGGASYFAKAFKAPRRVETATASSPGDTPDCAGPVDPSDPAHATATPAESSKPTEPTENGVNLGVFEQLLFTGRYSTTT
ncbi:unnamed protein product [Phytomonas sp. Hart1]|nr:unnamed protein product [Phytomonas sp. Hart1]|eukprot:CCW67500.1 unnamed protein product [Phytomonas sp. isolate Hart1]